MNTSAPHETPVSAALVWSVYKVPIILGSISLLCIVLSITIFIKSYQSSAPITFSSDQMTDATVAGMLAENSITVDIEGAIVKPGVYRLPFGSRVEDVVSAAGGFSAAADMESISKVINRAAKVSDGAKLYIPDHHDAAVNASVITSDVSTASVITTGLTSVNGASQSELEALNGIGPATAKKIIAGRPYQTLEEVVQKKALSQSLFTKLKDQLSL